MEREPKITQPSAEEQREYASLYDNTPTIVGVLGTKKKYKIRWMKNVQVEYLSRLLIRKGSTDDKDAEKQDTLAAIVDDSRLGCKAAAIAILNGYWKLKFFYSFLWHWFYYIKQYDNAQLQPLIDEMKKKIPLTQFLMLTMSLTGARGTLMNMRTEEAERTLRELASAQEAATEKRDNG